MKQIILLVCTISLFVGAGGCSLNKSFVKAVDNHTQVILPEYIKYIENDAAIEEATKRIRKQSAETLKGLIEEAKED